MKVLVTGAKGFVGKNLAKALYNLVNGYDKRFEIENLSFVEYDVDNTLNDLKEFTKDCDFVFNLAGVNRPKNQDEFIEGNADFLSTLINFLVENDNVCPIMLSSSTQAELLNEYGKSKKEGERRLKEYGEKYGVKTYIYRFPNVFGKWCRPNYNSAVATFCNNVANDLPIQVNNRDTVLNLVYIDDVVDELLCALRGKEHRNGEFCYVPTVHTVSLGEIVDYLYWFKTMHETFEVPTMDNLFVSRLYATYLSYLPKDKICYDLITNVDNRGSFTEMVRSLSSGQVSVNISKPHIVKGNHWHNTKNEKFIVVKGRGVIRLQSALGGEVQEYYVSGDKLQSVEIPTGYTHNIENLGDEDMITVMWASECFDKNKPDTYFMPIEGKQGE